MNKKMKRLSLIFSVVLMVSIIVGTQFVPTVSAKKPIVTYYPDDEFTQIIGKLDGALYEILIPDNWNGMLIVGCRGYRHILPSPPTWPPPKNQMHLLGLYFVNGTVPTPSRFAFAFSTYGKGGWSVKEGMIRTHQLTKFVIDNYNVPGKVFLMGYSMGGLIACMLGEKYPNLYSGVLDVCGVKSTTMSYEYQMLIGSMSIEEIRSYLGWPPFVPVEEIQVFKDFCLMVTADIEIACGGTPQEKPKAYERRSPIYYPEVSVPVIIVHGVNDFIVPIGQSEAYEQAVNDATEPDLCRLYPKGGVPPTGGHCTPDVIAQGILRFYELVAWSNTLDP